MKKAPECIATNWGACPVVKSESEAIAVYDMDAHEFVARAPGIYWSLRKSKWLREDGSGHKCVYLGWPERTP